ncbi:hypothetical protein KIL84_016874, partial [Mauremys mutica]
QRSAAQRRGAVGAGPRAGRAALSVPGLGAAACSALGSGAERSPANSGGAFPLPGARGRGLLWLQVKELGKHVAGFLVQVE